jgi:Peptidase family M50/Tetratricopeptide repeat
MVRLLFGLVAMPLLMLEIAWFRDQPFSRWAIGNVLLYPCILVASIAVHEIGHAAAARAVGLRALRIHVGVGRRVAKWRWGSLRVVLNAFPVFGFTLMGSDATRALRWRVWLSILAGPLATLAVVIATLAASGLDLSDVLWPSGAVAGGAAIAPLLGFQNFWMLVGNLLPLRIAGHRSDGMQLIRLPFAPARELELLRAMPAQLEAWEYMAADDHDAAQRVLDEALTTAPGSWLVRNDLAALHIRRGRLADARALLLELIAEQPPIPELQWFAFHNLAWADFVLEDPALQSEADRYSLDAYTGHKNVPCAMGTRGAVLGWLGRHEEAIELQEQSFLRESEPSGRAEAACGLAISCAALARIQDAERWLARARANHTRCQLLERAAAAIASARGKADRAVAEAAAE